MCRRASSSRVCPVRPRAAPSIRSSAPGGCEVMTTSPVNISRMARTSSLSPDATVTPVVKVSVTGERNAHLERNVGCDSEVEGRGAAVLGSDRHRGATRLRGDCKAAVLGLEGDDPEIDRLAGDDPNRAARCFVAALADLEGAGPGFHLERGGGFPDHRAIQKNVGAGGRARNCERRPVGYQVRLDGQRRVSGLDCDFGRVHKVEGGPYLHGVVAGAERQVPDRGGADCAAVDHHLSLADRPRCDRDHTAERLEGKVQRRRLARPDVEHGVDGQEAALLRLETVGPRPQQISSAQPGGDAAAEPHRVGGGVGFDHH